MILWAALHSPIYREHMQLQRSSEYNDWLQSPGPVLTCQLSSYTVFLEPYPLITISAPLTEMVSLFLYSPVPEAQLKRCKDWQRRLQYVLQPSGCPEARGCLGMAAGWSTEEVKRNASTVKIYTVLFGWQSETAEKRVKELCAFTDVLAGPTRSDGLGLGEAGEWRREDVLGFDYLIPPREKRTLVDLEVYHVPFVNDSTSD